MPGSLRNSLTYLGNAAAMFGDDLLRGRVKLPRTAVVAEAFPQSQHLLLVGRRQPRDVRKRADEPREIVAHRRHLRLLQHDLADPHAIRIARAPPGQIAGMLRVPGQQSAAQRLLLRG